MSSVSIVILAHNPKPHLLEAIGSARAQTCGGVEIVLVNDGTDTSEGLGLLRTAAPLVDRYLAQAPVGVPAARNAGFRAATGEFAIPLNADDLLDPNYAAACLAAAAEHPDAAFLYTGSRFLGADARLKQAAAYNLYRLLGRNYLPYAALIRRSDWENAGGYDESMTAGHDDWEFWLRLGARDRFGWPVSGAVLQQRSEPPSYGEASASYIRTKHHALYSVTGMAALKARWEPSVCIVGKFAEQTLEDCAFVREPADAPANADAFLLPDPGGQLDPHSGEYAALAVWGGRSPVRLPDNSVASSREELLRGLPARDVTPASPPRFLRTLRAHLEHAELLSARAWTRHPLRSGLRLVPLRWKERANRRLGRQIFDLTFYLRYQPASVALPGEPLRHLQYLPQRQTRARRVALVTPHLGPGGAERVLLDIAAALDRSVFEILLIAGDSRDSNWSGRWRQTADHVYDLAALALPENLPAALYSVLANWKPDTVLIQNSPIAYAVVPHLRRQNPPVCLMDLVHSVDADWNILAATHAVAGDLDFRVAVSETVRSRIIETGHPAERTLLAPSGIDLARFTATRPPRDARPFRILFAGRLDPVKRPMLLPEIARELRRRRPSLDFRFAVAGEGSEGPALIARVKRSGLAEIFEFQGHVPDISPLLAESDLLVLPSRAEGIPLAILEAFAASRPVIASSVGAIPEVVNNGNGVLIPQGEGDAKAFAEVIDRLLQDPVKRCAMGENGRRLVAANFTLESARRTYRGLFELRRDSPGAT